MALVQCPGCGEMISERAKKCVHCGYEIFPEEKILCSECGSELEKDMTVCPVCGCPVENEAEPVPIAPQQVEVTSVKVTQKSKKAIIIVIAAVVIIAAAIFGVQQVSKAKAKKEADRISQEYAQNMNLAAYTMINGAADAESCGNLIKKVWYNSIYKEFDSETNKYTRPNGYFVSDFNTALTNLFSDSSFSSKISDIKSNQDTVQELMKSLKNAPDEHIEAYKALSTFYDNYLELTNLVVNPSGSLQTFSSNFNDADSATSNSYNALKIYID